MNTPFLEAMPIIELLHSAGYEAYFVGGAVRDVLLGREIGDIDIATSAKPEEIQDLFSKTIDVGAEHGTIIVLHEGNSFEVTTFRSESEYDDFRRPRQVDFISSLEEDLKRRDFTINAMAMDVKGQIIDYFHGQSDLAERVIRTVGIPAERFHEDALRMLRAVRFVSQLQFQLTDETKEAIRSNAHLLNKISIERKVVEVEKLLVGNGFKEALYSLINLDIHSYLPGFHQSYDQISQLAELPLHKITRRDQLWTILAYIVKPIEVESFLRQWKLPNKLIRAVHKNLHFLHKRLDHIEWTEILIYEAGEETAKTVELLVSVLHPLREANEMYQIIEAIVKELPILTKKELDITGKEVLDWLNKEPGPWVSKTISQIECAVVKKEIPNQAAAIKEWVLNCNQK
ncbi:CCA tRNA nucleotidyltransferase [Bacillus weihaiensis]|uniref:CCA-adding enzyme n=1 Tax=Bacillus weihaiensis TaxID=1547283 RepID=A0A1L3MQK7_9BACI|nr:CCA tRNA nucleotidyltransferase [Bacillus weihaiensis]APH04628.1 CCA tRNA nucleotidyltransferase [Bacillus weihaiensis]